MAANIIILIATFLFMEFVAWFSHKYIMHGFMWFLHKDHHQVDKTKKYEMNDLFFLMFAIPSFLFIVIGVYSTGIFNKLQWIGYGIALYGFFYVFVHDIFIHQRIKILTKTKNSYLLAMRRAHKIHHKKLYKENGEAFGFLWVPSKYRKK